MINHFQKIQQELQTTPGGKSHRFALVPRSREAMYSLLELFSTGFLFSRYSPVVDKGFTEISRSQVGEGEHDSAGSRNISVNSQPWHADGCVSPPSKTGQELPSNGPYKDWLNTWALEVFPQNSLRQHYSCLIQWQLVGPMALHWIAPSLTTYYCIKGIKRYEESPLVSIEDRELLRTAPFGALSLFDKLATKLQLRDKVASRQRDYALYRGSAPFNVGKTCYSTSVSTG